MDDSQITYEYLCDEGKWVMASKQTEKIPQLVLDHIKQAAKKALITMPTCESEL